MRIVFVNGHTQHLTFREVMRVYQHRQSVALVIASLVLFISLKPHAVVVPSLPFFQMTLLWANSVIGFFAIFLGACAWADKRGGTIWTIGLLMLISLYQTLGGAMLVVALGHPAVPLAVILQLIAFHLVLLVLVELVFTAFILPTALKDISTNLPEGLVSEFTQGMAVATGPETVVLLGQRFGLDDLLQIEAQEHYVQITTLQGRHMLRGRISDIELQLPADLGMRVHRSHWVAVQSVASLQRGASWTLKLTDGTEVPVARARREMVRDWVAGLGRPVR